MEVLLNAFMAIGLLVVIILIVYLVDRVNNIERETRRVAQSVTVPHAPPLQAGPFGHLSGKALWDALSGKPPPGMDDQTLQDMRESYELVLHKHIQSVFEEGVKDAQRGLSGEPRNPRTIKTARGVIDSWMPGSLVNTLYKCGLDAVQQEPQTLESVRAALDEAGQQLFSRLGLVLGEPLSASLMPAQPPAGQPALAIEPGPAVASADKPPIGRPGL